MPAEGKGEPGTIWCGTVTGTSVGRPRRGESDTVGCDPGVPRSLRARVDRTGRTGH